MFLTFPVRGSFLRAPGRAGGAARSAARSHPPFSFRGKKTGGVTVQKKGVLHWQSRSRRAARAAQCKCGVHGFAMNPCESLPVATAPYCREARVTVVGRQTACRMRHCFARRIVETGGRWELLRTSTRWAERHPQGVCRIRKASEPPTAAQQRMIEAEANRLAMLTWQCRAIGSAIGKHCSSSSCSLAMGIPFSWGSKGDILFPRKENIPLNRVPT